MCKNEESQVEAQKLKCEIEDIKENNQAFRNLVKEREALEREVREKLNIPFYSACVSHDLCYESSSTKGRCDELFFKDMLKIAFDNVFKYSAFNRLVRLAGQIAMANVYYNAVDNLALSAWCAATTNTSKAAICREDLPPVGPGAIDEGGNQGTYSGSGKIVCNDWVYYGNTTADGFYCEGYTFRP